MKSMTVRVAAVVVAVLAVGWVAACGGSENQAPPNAGQTAAQPDHDADDVDFARNMIPHHQQAVDMAQMVPTNTKNPQVFTLADQIIATQVPELQAFRAWLMQWQEGEAHDPAAHGGMPMGMVDEATMNRLRTLTGAEFDRLWLTSMIDHHRGAIEMAQHEVAHGSNADVIYLAKSIIAAQQAEIDHMKKLLGG